MCFERILWEDYFLGTPTDIHERINHRLWRQSTSLHTDPVREHEGGGSLTGELEGFFFLTYIFGFLYLEPKDVANVRCGTKEETSDHILCECEALASFIRAYLGSFFLDPEDAANLNMGAIWNFGKGTGLL